ncbi:uncharacterized protein LOC110038058 [Phalaenopsis equestris]|uniref:uncharacterized protein LOC110038058 n=1 Tax=Phalaenopsis equestris TaxID=78828 RepID=UPI0009E1BA8C|nr:uncharacterized protein LOC110038058 [Phalaenopsis equestris]
MDHNSRPPNSPTSWPLFSSPPPAGGDEFHSSDDLRQALLRTTLELESTRFIAQEELRRLEAYALHLSHLLNLASRERDEARLHAHSLLLLLDHRHRPAPASSSSEEESSPAAAVAEEEMEAAARKRGLPEKGRLLEAVMTAGPLLQTLMLAGPLPEWRHPPPAMQGFEIPPVVMNAGDPRSRRGSPELESENKVQFLG